MSERENTAPPLPKNWAETAQSAKKGWEEQKLFASVPTEAENLVANGSTGGHGLSMGSQNADLPLKLPKEESSPHVQNCGKHWSVENTFSFIPSKRAFISCILQTACHFMYTHTHTLNKTYLLLEVKGSSQICNFVLNLRKAKKPPEELPRDNLPWKIMPYLGMLWYQIRKD